MSQAVEAAGLFDDGREFLGFSQIEGGRLVAQHVESGLQGGLGCREMNVVGRDNRHEVDPLIGRQSGLLGHQFLVAAIHPIRGEEEVCTGVLGFFRIR